MAAKGSGRVKKLVHTVKPRRSKPSSRVTRWTSTHVIAGGVVALFATAIAVGVYQGLHSASVQRTASRIARGDVPDTTPLTPPQEETAIHPEASRPSTVDQASDQVSAGVTITGCLERSDNRFRLSDAAGASAPTSRNWRSAFLKRRSAPIAIVATNQVNLTSHVGQRVRVTGTLVDREMRVVSLQRIASSCTTQKAKAI
jgi:hypothetical protein